MTAILRDVRFPIDNDRFISCRMIYDRGGENVWTGRPTPRAYKVSVSPVKRVRGFIETCPMDGVSFILKEVTRASRKAEDESSKVMDRVLDDLVRIVCDKNGIDPATLGPRVEV